MNLSFIVNEEKIKNPELKKALNKLEENQNKPASPEYISMKQSHAAALQNIHEGAKDNPWEWSFGLDYLVQFIRYMRDYYKLGENVWGMEKKEEDPKHYKNIPTRLETLEKTLFYYDKWQNIEWEYVTIIEHPETYRETDNGDGTVTINDLGFHCEYKCGGMKRTYRKIAKLQKKYKKLFFKTVFEYLESWWD